MTRLAEYVLHSRTDAIVFVDRFNLKVINKFPWCVLQCEANISLTGGNIELPNSGKGQRFPTSVEFSPLSLKLDYAGFPISMGLPNFHNFFQTNFPLTYSIGMTREAVDFIESKRVNDVEISLQFTVRVSEFVPKRNDFKNEEIADLRFSHKLSQSEWLRLLSEMGYTDKWIVEIDRPKLEGFHEVIEFLDKAKNGLFNNSSPDAVISDLRSAWDRLDPYLKKFEKSLKSSIDSGSKVEKGEPTKSERIEEIVESNLAILSDIVKLRKAIDKLTQIGPHKEVYASTREDAFLAYRLTLSLVSYYSGLLKVTSEQGGGREQK